MSKRNQRGSSESRLPSRSEAAKRGWETRRENERKAEEKRQERSEAARRGWQTRRENERREKELEKDVDRWFEEMDQDYAEDIEANADYEG